MLKLLQDVLTGAHLTPLAESLVPFMRESIGEAVAPLEQRLAALEQKRGLAPLAARLGALESRPLLEDGDIWDERSVYRKGAVVTHAGASWVGREPNSNCKPGTSNVWRLMHKSHGRR